MRTKVIVIILVLTTCSFVIWFLYQARSPVNTSRDSSVGQNAGVLDGVPEATRGDSDLAPDEKTPPATSLTISATDIDIDPIPGVSGETLEKIKKVIARVRNREMAHVGKFVDSVGIYRGEMKNHFSVSELVAITDVGHRESERNESRLREFRLAAFDILQRDFSEHLAPKHVRQLLRNFQLRGNPDDQRAMRASRVLGSNRKYGVPALARILKRSKDNFERVHAAGGLVSADSKSYPELVRKAEMVLLKSFSNKDESRFLAGRYLRLKEWMIPLLLKKLSLPNAPPLLLSWAVNKFLGTNLKSHPAEFRKFFSMALEDGSDHVRVGAVEGLFRLGISEKDSEIFEPTLNDEVFDRARLAIYSNIIQRRVLWGIPILVRGMGDSKNYNRKKCIMGLGHLKYRPIVPKLISILRANETDEISSTAAIAAQAIIEIAGLKGYRIKMATLGGPQYPQPTEVTRIKAEHNQKEFARLLEWWDRDGKSINWEKK